MSRMDQDINDFEKGLANTWDSREIHVCRNQKDLFDEILKRLHKYFDSKCKTFRWIYKHEGD